MILNLPAMATPIISSLEEFYCTQIRKHFKVRQLKNMIKQTRSDNENVNESKILHQEFTQLLIDPNREFFV